MCRMTIFSYTILKHHVFDSSLKVFQRNFSLYVNPSFPAPIGMDWMISLLLYGNSLVMIRVSTLIKNIKVNEHLYDA